MPTVVLKLNSCIEFKRFYNKLIYRMISGLTNIWIKGSLWDFFIPVCSLLRLTLSLSIFLQMDAKVLTVHVPSVI